LIKKLAHTWEKRDLEKNKQGIKEEANVKRMAKGISSFNLWQGTQHMHH